MEYRWIQGEGPGFEAAKLVRRRVFMEEQGFENEFDALDAAAWHLVGQRGEAPVCTARLFLDGEGRAHFGRVAVLPAGRGSGCGLEMLRLLEVKARQLGAPVIVLEAQADKAAFYRRAGFAETGRQTLDEGMPHVEMAKALG